MSQIRFMRYQGSLYAKSGKNEMLQTSSSLTSSLTLTPEFSHSLRVTKERLFGEVLQPLRYKLPRLQSKWKQGGSKVGYKARLHNAWVANFMKEGGIGNWCKQGIAKWVTQGTLGGVLETSRRGWQS